ncbi:exported hypothetical protein [Candidatus Sulfopaludibacter sp. SbA4]|nr:exported hypothetical protein [Candidatus Sulfopaludibacter sp. SbA4]
MLYRKESQFFTLTVAGAARLAGGSSSAAEVSAPRTAGINPVFKKGWDQKLDQAGLKPAEAAPNESEFYHGVRHAATARQGG